MKISGRIPISISPYFWVLAGLIGWLNTFEVTATLIWMVVIIFSVLFHEYGHALTAIAFGQTARIELVSFGGVTHRRGPKLKPWKEFLVVLNGPCFGLILFAITYYLAHKLSTSQSLFAYGVRVTMAVNLFWSVINLLPVLPLDGGRLMSIFCEGMFGVRGVKIALFLSIVLAVLFALGFFLIHAVLVGALFFFFAFESYRAWQSSLRLTEQDQDEHLQELMRQAESDFRGGRAHDAIEKLQQINAVSRDKGIIYVKSAQLLAALLAQENRWNDVYDMLKSVERDLNPESLMLLHHAAYFTGDYKGALEIGTRNYQNVPSYETALLNAYCCGRLGHVEPAVGWLQCAEREGLPDLADVLRQSEFDSIRNDPRFQDLVKEGEGS